MAKTLLFIVNPRAGRTRSTGPLFDAAAHFCDRGYLVNVRQTTARADATRFVLEEGAQYDAIVCCGGDGTLNEVVCGAMQLPAPPPIGYIPSGSTNDFAASLKLPDQPLAAAVRITGSAGRFLDVGCFNGRPFVYVASFGAFTKASYSAPQNLKNDLGHLAYILEGAKDLSTLRPYRARITTEEETFEGDFLFGAVTNATSIGGLMKLQESLVSLDDGHFELLLIPLPKSITEVHALAKSLVLQDFTRGGLIFRHVSSITVDSPEAFAWALDGEYESGSSRVDICNLHRKLRFLL